MSNLVERLRAWAVYDCGQPGNPLLMLEAADEIERLAALTDRLVDVRRGTKVLHVWRPNRPCRVGAHRNGAMVVVSLRWLMVRVMW